MTQKGFAPILIVLILAALVGGYFLYSKQKPSTPLSQTVQPTSTPSSTPESTNSAETVYTESDRSANWKIYTTEAYKIEYPAEWTIVASDYLKTIQLSNQSRTVSINISEGQYPYGFGGPGYEFKKQTIEVFINGEKIQTQETILNKKKAYVDFQVGTSKYHILFGTGYPAAEDELASLSDYYSYKNTVLKILSTFKFTQ